MANNQDASNLFIPVVDCSYLHQNGDAALHAAVKCRTSMPANTDFDRDRKNSQKPKRRIKKVSNNITDQITIPVRPTIRLCGLIKFD